MKETRMRFIYLLAGVGIAALLYVAWTIYQQRAAQEQSHAFFSATPQPGIPDILHAPPSPPPQP